MRFGGWHLRGTKNFGHVTKGGGNFTLDLEFLRSVKAIFMCLGYYRRFWILNFRGATKFGWVVKGRKILDESPSGRKILGLEFFGILRKIKGYKDLWEVPPAPPIINS